MVTEWERVLVDDWFEFVRLPQRAGLSSLASDANSTVITLSGSFASRYGVPVVRHVDVTIFLKQYFTHCLSCTFCADSCCSYGVDVDLYHLDRMMQRADALEAYTGVSREKWFVHDRIEDPELPGGGSVRTRVVEGACVFLDRKERGCTIHKFCVEFGIDYHELKSMVDCLFPLCVSDATLCPADEVDDGTLACVATGPTLYRGLRHEIGHYFGDELVKALDRLEEDVVGEGP